MMMQKLIQTRKKSFAVKVLSHALIGLFLTSIISPNIYAQSTALPVVLPAPGEMMELSKAFDPVTVKGIIINPEHPFKFDFVMDSGDTGLQGEALRPESMKIIKYFLAALTLPEEEMWVNLSPYEKDRIIPKSFGETAMGRDVLAQDYILKQLTASLTYPERKMGKEFWDKVYAKAWAEYHTTDIPVNTFNKVWILPSKAKVYEYGNGAFVVESRLKVMLEEDYMSLSKHSAIQTTNKTHTIASQIVREIIIPALEKEVNEGENFANLRQVYQAMILATWYKVRLKDSILGQLYVDQHKIKGVALNDKQATEKIYRQYIQAFKKGVYNYVKEDYDPQTQQMVPKKYVSGGLVLRIAKVLSLVPVTLTVLLAACAPQGTYTHVTVDAVPNRVSAAEPSLGIMPVMSREATNPSSTPLARTEIKYDASHNFPAQELPDGSNLEVNYRTNKTIVGTVRLREANGDVKVINDVKFIAGADNEWRPSMSGTFTGIELPPGVTLNSMAAISPVISKPPASPSPVAKNAEQPVDFTVSELPEQLKTDGGGMHRIRTMVLTLANDLAVKQGDVISFYDELTGMHVITANIILHPKGARADSGEGIIFPNIKFHDREGTDKANPDRVRIGLAKEEYGVRSFSIPSASVVSEIRIAYGQFFQEGFGDHPLKITRVTVTPAIGPIASNNAMLSRRQLLTSGLAAAATALADGKKAAAQAAEQPVNFTVSELPATAKADGAGMHNVRTMVLKLPNDVPVKKGDVISFYNTLTGVHVITATIILLPKGVSADSGKGIMFPNIKFHDREGTDKANPDRVRMGLAKEEYGVRSFPIPFDSVVSEIHIIFGYYGQEGYGDRLKITRAAVTPAIGPIAQNQAMLSRRQLLGSAAATLAATLAPRKKAAAQVAEQPVNFTVSELPEQIQTNGGGMHRIRTMVLTLANDLAVKKGDQISFYNTLTGMHVMTANIILHPKGARADSGEGIIFPNIKFHDREGTDKANPDRVKMGLAKEEYGVRTFPIPYTSVVSEVRITFGQFFQEGMGDHLTITKVTIKSGSSDKIAQNEAMASSQLKRPALALPFARETAARDWKRGGIDLNAVNLDLEIKRDDKGMPLPFKFQNLNKIRIDTLYPANLHIGPPMSVPVLLAGLNARSLPGTAMPSSQFSKLDGAYIRREHA